MIRSRLQRVNVPRLLVAVVVGAGAVTIALLIFSARMMSATLDGDRTVDADLARLKVQAALSDEWLEEAVEDDRSIEVEPRAYPNIAAARSRCLRLRKTEADAALTRFCARLQEVRVLVARPPTPRTAEARDPKDRLYDEAFEVSMAIASEAQSSISASIARARRIDAGIGVGFFLIFAGTTLAVGRGVRRLAAYNERLRRLARIKDNLIASVSHEFRTPLTSTIGFLRTVERSDVQLDDDAQRQLIAIARAQAERLARLVDDLLFVAEAEDGRLRLAWGSVDLAKLAEECVWSTGPLAHEKGVALRCTCAARPRLRGDRGRIAQVLDNLVSNAIKFTDRGGRVDVVVVTGEGEARVEVSDTGIGVPAAEQGQLFERFFRASTATENGVGGTGLGLPIAKAIVEGHGGQITIQSEEGRGTTVRVRLPIVVAAAPELRA